MKSLPISRHDKQPNTPARQEYKGKIYVKNFRKKLCRNQRKVGSGSEKNHSGSSTLLKGIVRRDKSG